MNCSICGNKATIPVRYAPEEIWSCDDCWSTAYSKLLKAKKQYPCDLGSVVDKYPRKDGSVGKITKGKAWEIDNRRTMPDGSIVNQKTGREAQY